MPANSTSSKEIRHSASTYREGKLPVWIEGNAYLGGAKPSKKDVNALISAVAREDVRVELVQKEDGYYLDTNVYELIEGFKNRMIDSDVLGKAFEPEERFENPDGTAIRFDSDYLERIVVSMSFQDRLQMLRNQ